MIKKICSTILNIFYFIAGIFLDNFQVNIIAPAAALTAGTFSFFTFISSLVTFKTLSHYNHMNTFNNTLTGATTIVSLALLITFSIIYFQLRKKGGLSSILSWAVIIESAVLCYLMFVYFHNSDILVLILMLICISSCIFNLSLLFSISMTLICLFDIFLLLFSGTHLSLVFSNSYGWVQSISFINMDFSPISFILLLGLYSLVQHAFPSAYVKRQEKLEKLSTLKKQITALEKQIESVNQEKEELINKQNTIKIKIKNIESAITNITSVISKISDNFIKKSLTTDEAVKVANTYLDKVKCYLKETNLEVTYKGSMLLANFFKRLEKFLFTNDVKIAAKIKKADSDLKFALQGQEGEDLVRKSVITYNDLTYLNSINLHYNYKNDSKRKDNQIDGIVINNRGIFILEIKNYHPFSNGEQPTVFEINPSGYLKATRGTKDLQIYGEDDKNNSIRKQMDLHKAALSTLFQNNNKLKYLNTIHTVCVISRTDNIITSGDDIADINNLYSKFLGNSDFELCLTNDDIKEIKNILLKNNLEERLYPYTILKDIPNELLKILYSDDNWYRTSSANLIEEKEKLNQTNNELTDSIIKLTNNITKLTDKITSLEDQKLKIKNELD